MPRVPAGPIVQPLTPQFSSSQSDMARDPYGDPNGELLFGSIGDLATGCLDQQRDVTPSSSADTRVRSFLVPQNLKADASALAFSFGPTLVPPVRAQSHMIAELPREHVRQGQT